MQSLVYHIEQSNNSTHCCCTAGSALLRCTCGRRSIALETCLCALRVHYTMPQIAPLPFFGLLAAPRRFCLRRLFAVRGGRQRERLPERLGLGDGGLNRKPSETAGTQREGPRQRLGGGLCMHSANVRVMKYENIDHFHVSPAKMWNTMLVVDPAGCTH